MVDIFSKLGRKEKAENRAYTVYSRDEVELVKFGRVNKSQHFRVASRSNVIQEGKGICLKFHAYLAQTLS